MRGSAARRRYLRKHHPFPRFTFDAAWRASIEALTRAYMATFGRGTFKMRRAHPGAPAPFVVDLTLPDGRVYSGYLRKHINDGKPWFEGFLDAHSLAVALRDDEVNADGAVPADAHPKLNLWPRQLKINPAPLPQSGRRRCDYVGTLWVSAANGKPGGELYSVFADIGWTCVMKGYVARYKRRR